MTKNRFKRLPNHVAIIPDGNRRWARSHGLRKEDGYAHGLAPGLALYEQCLTLGIKEMTFYGFTNDNTKRPSEQTQAFRCACVEAVSLMEERDAAILVVGNHQSTVFPSELKRFRTRQSSGKNLMKINFLVNYDWRWDMNFAYSETIQNEGGLPFVKTIGSAEIPRVDLVIRWGGRRRLSGMLPVQTVYADFYVIDDFWPDLKPEHLTSALSWYEQQDITLGG